MAGNLYDSQLHSCAQSALQAKIRDPDADDSPQEGGRDPPNIFWRVAAALMYIIPWIDVIALGREVYHNFPSSIVLFLFPGMQFFSATFKDSVKFNAAYQVLH